MLEYLQLIGSYLIFFIPLFVVLQIAFGFLQIPFALIGRWAVYTFFLLKVYIYSLYFAICALALQNADMPLIPCLIIFSFVLYASIANSSKDAKDDGEKAYHLLSGVISVILFLIMTFNEFFYGKEIILKYLNICESVMNLPIIGDIITFILPFLSFVCFLWTCFQIFIIFTVAIIPLYKKIIQKSSA